MSPSESELRAALRHGEGEGIDAGRVIAHAREIRHSRRARWASVAAAVIAVGAVGTGTGLLINQQHTGGPTSAQLNGPNETAGTTPGRAAGTHSQATRIAPGPLNDAAHIPCPARPPRLMLPGGGSPGQFGSSASLFSGPVEAVKVCGYSVLGTTSSPTQHTVLTGEHATELAASLDAASTRLLPILCPVPADATTTLVVIGASRSGTAMAPVVVPLTCNGRVTNGTAVRYNWRPPATVAPLLPLGAMPSTGVPGGTVTMQPTAPPGGRVSGSPLH